MKMMEQVHLAGEDEEDLYSGYNDYNATLDTDVSIDSVNIFGIGQVYDNLTKERIS